MLCIKNGTLHTAVSKELVLADILIDARSEEHTSELQSH